MKRLLVSRKYRYDYKEQVNKSVKNPLYSYKSIEVIQLTDSTLWVPINKLFTEEGYKLFREHKYLIEEYDTAIGKPLF
jgi:hypothetical protein